MEQTEIESVKKWVSVGNASKRTTLNRKITSYGLKHIVEKDMGVYISNEALIKALVELGFTPNKIKNSPNYYFNITPNTERKHHGNP